jgi:putative polyhydroxyalkanoate system protein
MAKIDVHRSHHLTHAKAKRAAETLAKDLKEKFNLAWEWSGDHIEFHRTGLSGRLLVAPSSLDLHVELGFLLTGFKGSIEREIHRQLDEILGKLPAPGEAKHVPATTKAKGDAARKR